MKAWASFNLLLLALLLVVGAGYLGLWTWLGAHPFWGARVAIYGAPMALLLWILSRWQFDLVRIGAMVLTLGALFAATRGKEAFAASFAENALAGQIWFLGWLIGLGAMVAALGLSLERIWRRAAP